MYGMCLTREQVIGYFIIMGGLFLVAVLATGYAEVLRWWENRDGKNPLYPIKKINR